MIVLLITLAGSATAGPPKAPCPAAFEATELKIERRGAPSRFSPTKTDMPDTTVRLMCRVEKGGGLKGCEVVRESPPGWGFSDWARREAGRWTVVTRQVHGCPVAGRPVGLTIRSVDR